MCYNLYDMSATRRDRVIIFRVRADERKLLEEEARAHGRSLSEHMRLRTFEYPPSSVRLRGAEK